jgi:hypothetical protein
MTMMSCITKVKIEEKIDSMQSIHLVWQEEEFNYRKKPISIKILKKEESLLEIAVLC